jgi:2-oxo-4-hydroxy-4-carboxy-5-ureidoimidazoline decarboxylase
VLNALSVDEARAALLRCCGATRWAGWLLTQRPFASTEALLKAAAGVWTQMEKADMLEAFSHHPEIGSDPAALRERFAATAAWASAEQAGVAGADEATLEALREGNVRYREKFGYVFLVCATGRTAAEMLALLRARLAHDPETELPIAAAEQAKITRLRLEKLH